MSKQLLTYFLDNEYWYGGIVSEGDRFPLSKNDKWTYDLSINMTANQMETVFLSTKGRVIASKKGFFIDFEKGKIFIDKNKTEVNLYQAEEKTLKGAYLKAKDKYFPFYNKIIPHKMYDSAQFNTWIQLLYNQNELEILTYAEEIIKEGYKPGILMIDDGWSPYYGKWVFSKAKFDNPVKMIDSLHQKGFKIMLWICPHISPDSEVYRELVKKNYLIKNKDNEIAIRKWWNGYSAILDMSNPETQLWMKIQLDNLINNFGVDGFKFDAGDASFYYDDDITFGNVDANEQSYLWAKFAEQYEFNELRAAVNNGGNCLVQRLADKNHSWEKGGIASLIPHHLIQSLFGYPYNCPDMIGGGEYLNFLNNKSNLDQELFVRHAQISCLMPMMQFSAAPWNFLTRKYNEACYKAYTIRQKFLNEIDLLFKQAALQGIPITTPLEFYFANQGFEHEKQAFMLGSKIMVVPIIEKSLKQKSVKLPKLKTGKWQSITGKVFEGNQTIVEKINLDTILIYKIV